MEWVRVVVQQCWDDRLQCRRIAVIGIELERDTLEETSTQAAAAAEALELQGDSAAQVLCLFDTFLLSISLLLLYLSSYGTWQSYGVLFTCLAITQLICLLSRDDTDENLSMYSV